MKEFKPTRLMIKRHKVTGLKYFCKSTIEQYESYKGSGEYWQKHIKKHGTEHVVTDWVSEVFTDSKEIEEFALDFSKLNNIVESKEWANMKPENGLDGGGPGPSEEGAKKLRETFQDPEWKETVGKERTRKSIEGFKKTVNDPVWKATKGAEASRKRSEALTGVPKSEEHRKRLKETQLANGGNGPEKHSEKTIAKMKARYQDDEWRNTVWEEANRKRSEKQADPKWKATVGVESYRKMAATRSTPEWQLANSKECPCCKKRYLNNCYQQHVNKCKLA